MPNTFDIIVLGLGAMGSASLYQLAKAGKRVLGLDQFHPPHTLGSSHGETRIIRQAIGEGEEYVPLVLRSYELWRQIESEAGTRLLETTGGLIMSRASDAGGLHGARDFLAQTIAAAQKFGIEHSLLDTPQIRSRFPQFNLLGDERGYYEPAMGFIRPELAVATQLALAEKHGAEIRTNERVLEIRPQSHQVEIRTTHGEYTSEQVVVSAGAWLPQLLQPPEIPGQDLAKYFAVSRQVLYWFAVKDPIESFQPGRFPVFIWELSSTRDDFIYGIPAIDGPAGGLKLGSEQHIALTSPETVDRTVTGAEIYGIYTKFVRDRLPGLSADCIKASACLYTSTPDAGFIIDFHPLHGNVLIVSPCSGHGFKHSAAIGEAVSDLLTKGRSRTDIHRLKWARLLAV